MANPTRVLLLLLLGLLGSPCRAAPVAGDAACLAPVPPPTLWTSLAAVLALGPATAATSPPGPFFAHFGVPLALCLAPGSLLPSRKYEVKLSFREPDARFALALEERAAPAPASRAPPGSRGANAPIGTTDGSVGGAEEPPPVRGAVAEDAEKIEFWTDAGGAVLIFPAGVATGDAGRPPAAAVALPAERVSLRVLASPRGPAAWRGAAVPPSGAWFDARLDAFYVFGLVPGRVRSLLVLVPLALAAAALAARFLLSSPLSPLSAAWRVAAGAGGKRKA